MMTRTGRAYALKRAFVSADNGLTSRPEGSPCVGDLSEESIPKALHSEARNPERGRANVLRSWNRTSVALGTVGMSGDSVTTALPPAERPRPTLDDYLGAGRLAELPSPLRHPVAATVWTVRALFGIVSLIVLLGHSGGHSAGEFSRARLFARGRGPAGTNGQAPRRHSAAEHRSSPGSDRLVRLAVGLAAAAAGECGGGCPID